MTKENDVMTLQMCVNYGGRLDADAIRDIAEGVAKRFDPTLRASSGKDGSGASLPARNCPTLTCLSARRVNNERPTFCSGKARIPRWSSSRPCGYSFSRVQLWRAIEDYAGP